MSRGPTPKSRDCGCQLSGALVVARDIEDRRAMCGIAGVLAMNEAAPPISLEALTCQTAALEHRGPDEFGFYRDERVVLVHTRLSIIDLASGQQPLCNEDGSLWVVFNGEIFNYLELRAELIEL